jgi:FAD/FMN-containing dehydrogenase
VTLGESVAQGAWISYWRFWQRYHRYRVDGLEHLDGPCAKLIVGYHARGIAMDMCMLTVALFQKPSERFITFCVRKVALMIKRARGKLLNLLLFSATPMRERPL